MAMSVVLRKRGRGKKRGLARRVIGAFGSFLESIWVLFCVFSILIFGFIFGGPIGAVLMLVLVLMLDQMRAQRNG